MTEAHTVRLKALIVFFHKSPRHEKACYLSLSLFFYFSFSLFILLVNHSISLQCLHKQYPTIDHHIYVVSRHFYVIAVFSLLSNCGTFSFDFVFGINPLSVQISNCVCECVYEDGAQLQGLFTFPALVVLWLLLTASYDR